MARPTKYQKAYAEQARKLCLLGYTDKELADFFEVNEATINRWKKGHKEFCESIKKGKDISDGNVVDSLYQRVMGFVAPDLDIRVINDKIVKTEITKHYPSDTAAVIFWLKNRQKKTWRDKIDHGIEGSDGGPVLVVNFTPADYAAASNGAYS
ncbi:Uncharacterised protein [Yersinia rohdei]|uniref:Phage terminase small subunit n=1 Tax=Yersinia rohdei TaxID=29485 RepID=A0A0U1HQT3_YERRO|nr:terminase [Yersinia rohdei]CQI88866.1 Uncharacterised protein [Yersinia rohdei]